MNYKYNQAPEPPAAVEWPKIGVVSSCEACKKTIYTDEDYLELKGGDFHRSCVNETPECGDLHIKLACENCGEIFYADEEGWAAAGEHYYCSECINGFPAKPLGSDRKEEDVCWDLRCLYELYGYLRGKGYFDEDLPDLARKRVQRAFDYADNQAGWYWERNEPTEAETKAFVNAMDMLELEVSREIRRAEKELKEVLSNAEKKEELPYGA